MLIKCPNCGKDTSNKAKFCMGCGYVIAEKKYKCKECGMQSVQKFKVCPNCGYKNSFTERYLKIIVPCGIIVCIILVLSILAVIRLSQFKEAYIPSESMENTLKRGQIVKYDTAAYKRDEVERFDVIVFEYPDDRSKNFIKRVIGLPGETITLRNGKVYIDGSNVALDEPYLKDEPNGMGDGTYEVPEGCYFVLGDNRNGSKDSRMWENKYVEEDMILGKVKLD